MLSNAYFLAKFRFDTVENEPAKNMQNFTKNYKICQFREQGVHPRGRHGPDRAARLGLRLGRGEGGLHRRGRARLALPRAAGVQQFLANFRQNFARFRLYWRRSLLPNTRFAAFFKIYQII